MTEERERSWRAAGERARLAVIPGGKVEPATVTALREVATELAAKAADVERYGRALKLRDVATKLRHLDRIVEHDCGCDGYKLRMLAAHFDYVAGNIDPTS